MAAMLEKIKYPIQFNTTFMFAAPELVFIAQRSLYLAKLDVDWTYIERSV
jgi:hypothetical protein